MKTRWEIRMNYRKTLRQAAELEGMANRLRNLGVREFSEVTGRMSGHWTGEMADQYGKKARMLQDKLGSEADSLKQTASAIRRMAANVYNAEMEAIRIAETRTYR